MKLYKSDKIRFISGVVLIIIIYSCYYIFFAENPNAALISRKLRHIITFSITILIYLVGTFHLGNMKDKWMSSLWHLVHVSGLFIIITIGLYDWLIGEITLDVKLFAKGIQEILISPVLYVAMGLINKTLNKGFEK